MTVQHRRPRAHHRESLIQRRLFVFSYAGFEYRYQAMPFHPLFIQSLQFFSSLRFMDWQHTNAQTDVAWSDRKQIGHRTYTDGVPIEHMITLANIVGADPWFCMPHTANDDYVRSFARLALDTLRVDLRVYIEHSNEVMPCLNPSDSLSLFLLVKEQDVDVCRCVLKNIMLSQQGGRSI